MIERMEKLRIIGLKTDLSKVVNRLHKLGVLHIEEKSTDSGLGIANSLPGAQAISEGLLKAKALVSELGISHTHKIKITANPGRIIEKINILASKVSKIKRHIGETDARIKDTSSLLDELSLLHSLGLEPIDVYGYKTLKIYTGYVRSAESLRIGLQSKISNFLFRSSEVKKKDFISLFVANEEEEKAIDILSDHGFTPLELKLNCLQITSPYDLFKKHLLAELKKFYEEKKAADRSLAALKKENLLTLPAYEKFLSDELEKAEAPLRFRETEKTFMVWGYVPKNQYKKVADELLRLADGNIVIEQQEITRHDRVPVMLRNARPVENFKFFLDLYSMPSYHELDPSWILLWTFPLIFGFMLGDIGYGIITLLLFLALRVFMPQFKKFYNIIIFASIATMLFGLVFGEFFGYELYHPFINRNPEFQLMTLLFAALAAGIIHVNLGLIAGFINVYKEHGFWHALLEKASWFVLELGVALVALSYSKYLALTPYLGFAVIALSIFMLYKGEGARGIVEIPSIFGNILSYARIMAIGLSSVGLALVINDLASRMFHGGILLSIVGVLILVVGHLINLGIGLLGSFLHTLRLHYVELFGKFYRGGGINYDPFGKKSDGGT